MRLLNAPRDNRVREYAQARRGGLCLVQPSTGGGAPVAPGDAHTSIALLHRLRDCGVELSIDDFGTGYSSLAYLQQLPVSELKIDRSFVTDIDRKPGSLQLVKTMIEMGHGMGLMVTAEGIETQAERDILKQLGCDVMQGYFGSRPLHGANLLAWLDHIQIPGI